jgi:hypothetical protein
MQALAHLVVPASSTPVRLLALSIVATASYAQPAAPVVSCDRTCLEGFVDRYLAAVVADDPTAAPLAPGVRITEDGQQLEPGDGLWNTLRAVGDYRLVVADPPAGQIALITTVLEGNADPAFRRASALGLRLKVSDGRIAEVEQIVIRDAATGQRIEAFRNPRAGLMSAVPPPQRLSRAELIASANEYFTGMQRNDGRGDYNFSERCDRLENGNRATNAPTPSGETRPDPRSATRYSAQWTCREQFESGLLHGVTRIRDRRFVAVDQERGLVAAFVFFDHEGGGKTPYTTRFGVTSAGGLSEPWTWEILEVFKIEDGQIAEIEALLHRVPYGMPSGWSSHVDAMSDRARDVTGYSEE